MRYFPYWHSISKRKARGGTRYRYRWGKGRLEYGSCQIPGSPGDEQTEARAMEVRRWISRGEPPERIKSLIRTWASTADP